MPTGEQVVAKAYELQHVIKRDWPGFDAPVPEVWEKPDADTLGLAGQLGTQHCAGSGCRVWHDVGIRAGVDYPDIRSMVYTPTACTASDAMGTSVDTPEVGCGVVLDWDRTGIAANADHFELVIGTDNWPTSVTTIGWNTDESGMGNFFERDAGLVVRFIKPKNLAAVTAGQAGGQDAGTPAGRVYAWAKANGWSDAGAAGLLGNLQQESNFWFDAVEGQGQVGEIPEDEMLALIVPGRFEGVGVLQWSFDRRTNLLAYCHSAGLPWYSPEAQMGFLQQELEEGYAPLLKALKNATDPVSAAIQLDSQFIRSGVKGARYDYAREQYKQIQAGDYAIGAAPSDDTALIVGAFILLGVI